MPECLNLHRHPSIDGIYLTEDGRVFRELPLHPDSNGYPLVRLERNWLTRRHTLMAETFVGPRPFGQGVRHKNGVPGDDRPENIEWGSQAENCADTIAHGRSTRGSQNAMAILSEANVLEIKQRRAAGERGCDLAKEFGVTDITVCDIFKGRTWKWLKTSL